MNRRILRCLLVLSGFAGASASQARPEFWETFQKTYQIRPGSKIADAACKNCHTSPPRRNNFGKVVEQTLVNDALTADGLKQAESQDSGTGKTFGELIRADIVPGTSGDPKPAESAPVNLPGGIPKHTFHPLLVHFPIALYFFGAFMEAFGAYRKRDDIRSAGFWSLLAALVSLVAVLPTGLIARARLGFPLEGDMLIHLSAAIASSVSLLAVVLWRRKGPTCHLGYWALLAVVAALIALTGHFGSQLIFGT